MFLISLNSFLDEQISEWSKQSENAFVESWIFGPSLYKSKLSPYSDLLADALIFFCTEYPIKPITMLGIRNAA